MHEPQIYVIVTTKLYPILVVVILHNNVSYSLFAPWMNAFLNSSINYFKAPQNFYSTITDQFDPFCCQVIRKSAQSIPTSIISPHMI